MTHPIHNQKQDAESEFVLDIVLFIIKFIISVIVFAVIAVIYQIFIAEEASVNGFLKDLILASSVSLCYFIWKANQKRVSDFLYACQQDFKSWLWFHLTLPQLIKELIINMKDLFAKESNPSAQNEGNP